MLHTRTCACTHTTHTHMDTCCTHALVHAHTTHTHMDTCCTHALVHAHTPHTHTHTHTHACTHTHRAMVDLGTLPVHCHLDVTHLVDQTLRTHSLLGLCLYINNKIQSALPTSFQSTFWTDCSLVISSSDSRDAIIILFSLLTCVAEKLDVKPQDRSRFFGVGGRNLRRLRSEAGECVLP